jgi:hypothetical protein
LYPLLLSNLQTPYVLFAINAFVTFLQERSQRPPTGVGTGIGLMSGTGAGAGACAGAGAGVGAGALQAAASLPPCLNQTGTPEILNGKLLFSLFPVFVDGH